jgi:hypothetical protein
MSDILVYLQNLINRQNGTPVVTWQLSAGSHVPLLTGSAV